MKVWLRYITEEASLQGIEFISEILSSGVNGEWKPWAASKYPLDFYVSRTCQNPEATWNLVFRTGTPTWPMVPVIFPLQQSESLTIVFTFSRGGYQVAATAAPIFKIEVFALALALILLTRLSHVIWSRMRQASHVNNIRIHRLNAQTEKGAWSRLKIIGTPLWP